MAANALEEPKAALDKPDAPLIMPIERGALKRHGDKPFMHRTRGDRLVVDCTPLKRTDGGVYLPASAKAEGQRGEVLAISRWQAIKNWFTYPRAARVRPGAVILFGRFAGTEFDVDDRKIKVLREEDVLLVMGDTYSQNSLNQ